MEKNIIENMVKSSYYLYLILAILTFDSCETDSNKKSGSKKIQMEGKIKDNSFEFQFDSLTSNFSLNFNPKDIFRQGYIFDVYGQLIEKRGVNFFGEEEVYLFDENNSLTEFRKLVKLNKNKIGLQEFIRYNNGIINPDQSHYFDFKIIDSSQTDYKIKLSYLGAFEIKKISLIVNDFSYQTDDLNSSAILLSTDKNSVSFWVKKDKVLEDEFDFFQINIIAEYNNSGSLIMDKSNPENYPKNQKVILRKFRKYMW